jgi:hypothetical protein
MKNALFLSLILSLILTPLMVAQTSVDPEKKGRDKGGKVMEIKGEITKIDAATKQIVVTIIKKKPYDITVQVIAKTVIKDKTGKLSFKDLKVGMSAYVKGQFKKDKTMIAYYIGVY